MRMPKDVTENNAQYAIVQGEYARVGDVIENQSRWIFSTRYRECLWITRMGYGPNAERMAADWDRVRQARDAAVAENDYYKDMPGVLRALGVPFVAEAGEKMSDANIVNACVRRAVHGTLIDRRRKEPISNWSGPEFASLVERIYERVWAAVPRPVQEYEMHFRRVEEAREADKAMAQQYAADDGPQQVRVVACRRNRGAEEDPQCFSGSHWLTVTALEN